MGQTPEAEPEYFEKKKEHALKYFTHVTKAYETLADDHQRAIYDEEQLDDIQYFSYSLGPFTFNVLYIFTAMILGSVVYLGDRKFGLVSKYILGKESGRDENACPIDHKKRSEMIEIARANK